MQKLFGFLILTTIATSVACGSDLGKTEAPKDTDNTAKTDDGGTTQTNNGTTDEKPTMTSEPCVTLSADNIDFGTVEVGHLGAASVFVMNCSTTQMLTVNAATTPDGFEIELRESLIEPGESVSIPVSFRPTEARDYAGEAVLGTNAGDVTLGLDGGGTILDAGCPMPVARGRVAPTQPWAPGVDAKVGETVYLNATQSTADDEIVTYEWSIVTKPVESETSVSDAGAAEPTMFIDAHGTYVLELRVYTAGTTSGCSATQLTVLAQADVDPNAYIMKLTWNTPGDADQTDASGTDMDLHYKIQGEAWNAAPYDVYWLNAEADWGTDGQVTVDRDDTDGAGPEQITHSYADPHGTYAIGVHYYAENGFGDSTATVRIYQGSLLLFEKMKTLSVRQFWYIGDHALALGLIQNDSVTDGFANP